MLCYIFKNKYIYIYIVLYYIILYYIVLHYDILYYDILYYDILYYIILHTYNWGITMYITIYNYIYIYDPPKNVWSHVSGTCSSLALRCSLASCPGSTWPFTAYASWFQAKRRGWVLTQNHVAYLPGFDYEESFTSLIFNTTGSEEGIKPTFLGP